MLGQRESDENSVFDFLYVDHERIGHYLSQLNQFGALTSLVRTAETSDKKDFKGKVPYIAEMSGSEGQKTSATRTFDPKWTQCLEFLELLQERDMITKAIEKASIGQFALVGGELAIIDVGIMIRLFKHDSIKSAAIRHGGFGQAPVAQTKAQRKHGNRSNDKTDVDAVFDIFTDLPHSIHARLTAGPHHVWCNLKPDCMVTSPSDILLKHGAIVDGTWHALGILDAKPGFNEDQLPTLARMFGSDPANQFLLGALQLFLSMRTFIGRPNTCHGITPLVIFREIER